MLNITFHFKELNWRIFHLFISLIAGFLLFNSYFLEMLLFILDSSNIPSLLISSPIDSIQSYLFLSIASSFYYICLPLLFYHSFMYLRPSFPEGSWILLTPIFFCLLLFLAWWITSLSLPFIIRILLSPYGNLEMSNILYWVPSLQGVLSFYFFLLSFTLFCMFSPLFLIIFVFNYCKHNKTRQNQFKSFLRYRLFLFFPLLLLLSFLTPPDIITLILVSGPIILILEFSSIVILLFFVYYNFAPLGSRAAPPLPPPLGFSHLYPFCLSILISLSTSPCSL